MPFPPTPPEKRFWPKVIPADNDCWEWRGYHRPDGYGTFFVAGKSMRAHRFAYEQLRGPIPSGAELDHICRNRGCVNPDHLRPVTHKQNMEHMGVPADNTSGVRGVSWYAPRNSWRAYVRHEGRQYHVGYFASLAEAEAAVVATRNEFYTHNDEDRKAS